MASMMDPKTCYATTKSGKTIQKTAPSASTVIDYPGIEKACEEIKNVAQNGMDDISDSINKVQVGSDTLGVADKNMQPIVEEVGNFLKSMPEQEIVPTLEQIKETALTAYNNKQEELNSQTQSEVEAEASSTE